MVLKFFISESPHGVSTIFERPDQTDAHVVERGLCKMISTGFQFMQEERMRQADEAGSVGLSIGLTGEALEGLADGPLRGSADLQVHLHYSDEDGMLLILAYPPRSPNDSPGVAGSWAWLKGTMDLLTDEIRDGDPFIDPFAFEGYLLQKLAALFPTLPKLYA